MATKKVADKKKNLMKNRLVSKKIKNGKSSKKSKNGKKRRTMKTKKMKKEMKGGVFFSFLTNKNDELRSKQIEILQGIINEDMGDKNIDVKSIPLTSRGLNTINKLYNKMMQKKNRRFKDAVFRRILIGVEPIITDSNSNLKTLITNYQIQKEITENTEPDATEDEVKQVDKVVCICFDASKYKNILIDADKQQQVMKLLAKNKIPVGKPESRTGLTPEQAAAMREQARAGKQVYEEVRPAGIAPPLPPRPGDGGYATVEEAEKGAEGELTEEEEESGYMTVEGAEAGAEEGAEAGEGVGYMEVEPAGAGAGAEAGYMEVEPAAGAEEGAEAGAEAGAGAEERPGAVVPQPASVIAGAAMTSPEGQEAMEAAQKQRAAAAAEEEESEA